MQHSSASIPHWSLCWQGEEAERSLGCGDGRQRGVGKAGKESFLSPFFPFSVLSSLLINLSASRPPLPIHIGPNDATRRACTPISLSRMGFTSVSALDTDPRLTFPPFLLSSHSLLPFSLSLFSFSTVTMVLMSVLSNCLNSIVNAEKKGKRQVVVRPSSKVVVKFLTVMMKKGMFVFLAHFFC